MKYPVGPETRKKAVQTEAGKLADCLNKVLYSADYCDIILPKVTAQPIRRWVAQDQVYIGDGEKPRGVTGNNERYFDTESLMRAIRDYLEFKSYEEVIP